MRVADELRPIADDVQTTTAMTSAGRAAAMSTTRASYTLDQLDMMQRMGLVPWVQRQGQASPTSGLVESLVATEPLAVDDTPGNRRLVSFDQAGQRVTSIGSTEARLLIVVESSAESVGSALSAEANELLMLMLRAIDLGRADFSLCVVATEARGGESVRVSDLLGPSHLGVLWLSHEVASGSEEQATQFTLSSAGATVPGFRVAHPERLLAYPLEKRGAWQVLKALRASLSPSVQA